MRLVSYLDLRNRDLKSGPHFGSLSAVPFPGVSVVGLFYRAKEQFQLETISQFLDHASWTQDPEIPCKRLCVSRIGTVLFPKYIHQRHLTPWNAHPKA